LGYNGTLEYLPHDGKQKMKQRPGLGNRQIVGEGLVVQPTGDKSFLRASSDGKVLCKNTDTCCYSYLEIKCPCGIKGISTVLSNSSLLRKQKSFLN